MSDDAARNHHPTTGETRMKERYDYSSGTRRALSQSEHEAWNIDNFPGTRQLCVTCDAPTGRCEEDSMYLADFGPLCVDCYELPEKRE